MQVVKRIFEPSFCVLLLGIVIFIAIYTDLTFYRLHSMRLGLDTGVYLQTLINFAHTGSTFNFGQNRPKLSLHDSWSVILAFAPIVALSPSVQTLLIAGVVVVAIAAIPIYHFARDLRLQPWGSSAIALAYLFSPTTQGLAFGNFTEATLIPVLGFSLALAVRKKALLATVLLAVLLTGVKEDQSLFLIWIGIFLFIWFDHRIGICLVAIGLVDFFGYEVYQHSTGYPAHNPGYELYDRHPLQHIGFLAEILAPFAFLPLTLGWRVIIALPFIFEITFNKPWLGQELARGGSHYTVPLLTIIVIGTALALQKKPNFGKFILPSTLIMTLFFNTTVFRLGRHEYPPQWGRYCEAEAAATDGRYHLYGFDKEDIFAVAAANPNVHFQKTGKQVDAPPWWSGKNPPLNAIQPSDCQ